jgi:hypothetical protein
MRATPPWAGWVVLAAAGYGVLRWTRYVKHRWHWTRWVLRALVVLVAVILLHAAIEMSKHGVYAAFF